jgi:hypothetical protein
MEAHMDTCRLRIKIGPYEMEAEGPRDFVEKHYSSFSEKLPQNTQLVPRAGNPVVPAITPNETPLNALAGVFHQESDGRLTLIGRPSGENRETDAALLILYGYKELRGLDAVSADDLLYGLKQAGFPIDRADRVMIRGENQGLVRRTGIRRGTRYRLTVPGIAKAKAIGQELKDFFQLK